jgi:hypothetical protein
LPAQGNLKYIGIHAVSSLDKSQRISFQRLKLSFFVCLYASLRKPAVITLSRKYYKKKDLGDFVIDLSLPIQATYVGECNESPFRKMIFELSPTEMKGVVLNSIYMTLK